MSPFWDRSRQGEEAKSEGVEGERRAVNRDFAMGNQEVVVEKSAHFVGVGLGPYGRPEAHDLAIGFVGGEGTSH